VTYPVPALMNSECIISPCDPVLITGSNGFVGTKLVEILLEYGFENLRCFVRPSSRLERLKEVLGRFSNGNKVELIIGDLLSIPDCRKAAEGVSVVYHLAAGIEKSFAGAFMNSVLTTRNLIDAFLAYGQPTRFVNVSSFAVYSNLKLERGALLDETCPLEDAPQQRFDAYGYAKLKQDELVMEYGKQRNLPYVIVRPGAVFGPGKPALSGRVGIDTFGFLVHLGGSNPLPLTYVHNCAEAIVLAGLKLGVEGEIFNVVDDDAPTARKFLRDYKKQTGVFSLSVPYPLTELLCAGWEKYSRATRNQLPPVFNRRRCAAEWRGNRYSNHKLKEKLGWQPRVKMKDAMSSFLAQFTDKNS
jgi:nucleoside-diphosphate-sugar epimerase